MPWYKPQTSFAQIEFLRPSNDILLHCSHLEKLKEVYVKEEASFC